MASKKVKIEGNCPYCNQKNSIIFIDHYYYNSRIPYATDIPTCSKCNNDGIEIRKINNRRYKVVGIW